MGPTCITNKQELLDTCIELASLTGPYWNLDVKPSWNERESNYAQIAVTGTQNSPVPLIGCFDFVIVEELVKVDGSYKSKLWQGFYNIYPDTNPKCKNIPNKKTSFLEPEPMPHYKLMAQAYSRYEL